MRKTFLKYCTSSMLCKVALTTLVLFLLDAGSLVAKTVTGTVTSASDHEPLIGVTVKVSGAKAGAVTDFNGKYSVNVDAGQALTFTYIGYVTKSVKVGAQSVINVIMSEDSKSLNEVVVVGYGTQKKKLVTGATVQLKGDDLSKLNTNNALQAMQGQTPGVNIISESGQPGADLKVIIRGQGSNTNNSPLYIIDGIAGDIKNINPSDIQSIDVLKDAASAAIYGAQAANGVVLVTTKTGKEGTAKVTFDGYYGWQNATRKIQLCDANEYMTLMDEQSLNSKGSVIDWKSKPIYDASGNVYDTDWMDQMFKDNAVQQSYVLGISGGTANNTYAISSGYYDQEGIVGGRDASFYDRYNLRAVMEQKLYGDFLKVGENLSFAYVESKGVGSGNMYNNALRGAYSTSPLMPVYLQNDGRADKNNGYSYSTTSDWNQYDYNAYASMMRGNSRSTNQNFIANVFAEIQPIKNLKIRTQLGYNLTNSQYRSFSPAYVATTQTSNTINSASQSMYKGHTIIWTNTAAYDWKLQDHAFNALIGTESERYSGDNISGTNSLLDLFSSWSTAYLKNAINTDAATASGYPSGDYRRMSYFGRLGWNWKETYMINASLRCDGSSRFAENHRWGWFPSVSAGWVISNEKFMQSTASWMDFFKIRGSWGQVGNNNIGAFLYASSVTLSSAGYNFGTGKGSSTNTNGAYANRLGNDDLKWETSEQTDLGFDARFLNSRLGLNFDWYYKKTKDWVIQAPIIGTAGADAPYINGGDVTNKGVEVNMTWNDKIGKDFSYNIGGNFAYNKNEVGKIPTSDGMIHGSTSASALRDNMGEYYRCSDGHAMGYFWGYKTAGLFQNEQEINDWVAAGNGILANTAPGDIKVVDVNHDGVINDNDKVDLGNGIPKWNFGFNLGCTYKNFDFSVVFQGASDFKVANGQYRNWGNNSGKANYTTYFLQRWTGEGTSNSVPRLDHSDHNWTNFSDLWLEDGDYLRISNITLGYDFSKLINVKYISQARFYAQIQNLYTFTNYSGMDPEVGFGGESYVSGIDAGCYPHARTILFGVNLKF
jgi:TonB-linked SusC/RagA family outer membrane protein